MKSALMLGVNPKAEREENDFYATNPKAIKAVLPFFREIGISNKIWECACGQGHISETLKANGYDVYSTDLIDRGYGDGIVNFLESNKKFDGDIVTNPPFTDAEKFIKKGFDLIHNGNKIALFLKVQFLEGQARKVMYRNYPLKILLVYSARQQCAKDADFEHLKATTQCYCWYVFEKGYEGKPFIDWI